MAFNFRIRPARMTFGNLATGKTWEAQYNPTELEEHVKPVWAKLKPIGSSHDIPHYMGTESHGFSFDLAFQALNDDGTKLDDIQASRRFLLSLCYTSRSAQTIQAAQPARILFVWPTMVSLSAIIVDLKFKHTDFNRAGTSTRMVATVSLEEAAQQRIYSEDVLASGTVRSSAPGGAGGWM